jgi:hypothetical protein
MVLTSSSAPSLLGPGVSEKLTKENYTLWKAQFLPVIIGAQLVGYLDGTTPAPSKTIEIEKDAKKQIIANPEYDSWMAKDQHVLGYLFNSLRKEVLAQVATLETASAAWLPLERMYSA